VTIWAPHIKEGTPRYAAIVDALAGDIEAGRLNPGDRLPTQRELADQLGLSVGTVTRAYADAERRGLVRGEIGRGTFVSGAAADEYRRADLGLHEPGVIDLALTHPLYSKDPDLSSVLRELARAPQLQELLRYQPNQGMQRHRDVLARWASRLGYEADANNVLVCAGTQHALTVTLASMVGRGGSLFVEELTYPGLKALANLLEIKMVALPMDDGGLVPEAFESACRQRRAKALFTITTLHNPLTTTMPEDRRREIAAIAQRHGVLIVEDAIHHALVDEAPPPLSVFAPEISFFVAAVSKVVTGGLRVACLAAPPDTVDRLTQAVWATHWVTAPLCAEIVTRWIEDGTAERTIREKKAEARARVMIAREILGGYRLKTDDHGLHAWLELPDSWENAAAFSREARRRGVTVAPADVFAVGGDAPSGVRLSLSAPLDREVMTRGLQKLARILQDGPCCGPPIV
jgi:DNA-binding transcriptional MocR family regulator